MQKVEKLPFWKQGIFALGQMGWSLASYSVANLINYFYLPPEQGQSLFPAFIYQGYVLGSFTIIGLINAFSRVFDAVTDPIVAGMSDRARFRFGRRRTFLLISFVPFVVTSLLVFFPLVPYESSLNVVWLTLMILLFYWFLTLFCTPYNAWLSELGHTPEERLNLATWISISWALGFALGNTVYLVQAIFEKTYHFSSLQSFQLALVAYGVIALILMALPIIFIDENRYCERHVSQEGTFEAVISAFKNKNFFFFTLSDFAYWVALTFIQSGIAYYTTVLLGLDKSNATTFMTVMFVLSFVFYVPINRIARWIGKKLMLSLAFVLFSLVFVMVFWLGKFPMDPFWQGILLVVLASLPIAIFGILPNAIVADIADADGKQKGNYKAAVFFGARTFMMKMGIAFTNLLFPSIINLGRSQQNPFGVRFTGVIAFFFCLAGLGFFLLYREKDILAIISPQMRKDVSK